MVTGRLALLADPSRVRLLGLLEQGEATARDLAEEITSTPQNVSRHLCILHRAGIVTRRREGSCSFYSLADYSACRLLEQAFARARAHENRALLEELIVAIGGTP